MKNLLKLSGLLLLICLFSFEELQAQQFKVQIGAYKNPEKKNFEKLYDIGDVYVEDAGNGISRIILGYYNEKTVADEMLLLAKSAGFPDAFVASHKIKISESAPNDVKSAAKLMEVADNLGPNQTFMIDLGTYRKLTDVPNLHVISDLGTIYQKQDGGNLKVLLGNYDDVGVANLVMAQLRNEGFKNPVLRRAERKQSVSLEATVSQPTKPVNNSALLTVADKSTPSTVLQAAPTVQQAAPVVQQPVTMPAPVIDPVPVPAPAYPAKPVVTVSNYPLPVAQLTSLFVPTQFDVFNVVPYDPYSKGDAANFHAQFKGQAIPAKLIPAFDGTYNASTGFNYFAIQKFPLTDTQEGYIVRSGKNTFNNDNFIVLHVYDTRKQRFIASHVLSSVSAGASYEKIESWIVDLNNDGVLDILSHRITEVGDANGKFTRQSELGASIWQKNAFMKGQILNETALRNKFGVK